MSRQTTQIGVVLASVLVLVGALLWWSQRTNRVEVAGGATEPSADAVTTSAPARDTEAPPIAAPAAKGGTFGDVGNTVVWISIDGFRPDYWDRGDTPFLDRLGREGAFSRQLVPVFPSLTFPSHVSQATGVLVRDHGIPGNSFIDRSNLELYNYPADSELMQAEPIWRTAAAQGVRSAVFDWPVSHNQKGEGKSAYFGERFDPELSDEERLSQLTRAWKADSGATPLRLLMGYAGGPDSAGHRFGPDAQEPVTRVEETDRVLEAFVEEALELWRRTKGPNDDFYLLLTTDHGMSKVRHVVSLEHLAGLVGDESVLTVHSGNVGHIFFRDRGLATRSPERLEEILAEARKHAFVTAMTPVSLPAAWGLDHPTRIGDIVLVLAPGYTFTQELSEAVVPVAVHGGPLGMHGYDVAGNPEMNGVLFLWRADRPLGGRDLGTVHSLQLHATVAKLLGVQPAAAASVGPIPLDLDPSPPSIHPTQ